MDTMVSREPKVRWKPKSQKKARISYRPIQRQLHILAKCQKSVSLRIDPLSEAASSYCLYHQHQDHQYLILEEDHLRVAK